MSRPAGSIGDDSTETTRLIAHRGFAGVHPENTLAAMDGAARDGADSIEIDVQLTADDELVVFHNRRLDPTTDREGVVSETPSDAVLDAEVLDSGETIPTLDAVMGAIPDAIEVNVELKYPGRPASVPAHDAYSGHSVRGQRERWEPLVSRTLEVIAEYDNPVLLSSFHVRALGAVRARDRAVSLAVLTTDTVERAFTIADRFDCAAINPYLGRVDRPLVARAHAVGLAVNAYTVTTREQATALRRSGVDGMIADSAAVLDRQSVIGNR